ncbi:MAG: hypothetical protein ABI134_05530 [Byssovorax sp.]
MRAGSSDNVGTRALAGPAAWLAFAAFVAPLVAGCGASVDMASAAGVQRVTMTVPYTNVRGEVRLYPDYGPIGASILAESDAPSDEKRPASSKKGKP